MLPFLYIKKKIKKLSLVFVNTFFHSSNHLNLAVTNANYLKIPLKIINLKNLHNKILNNCKLRCYHCKKEIFSKIKEQFHIHQIADGTNFTDTFEYRPGLKALDELGIISPFKKAHIPKKDILNYLIENNLKKLITEPTTCNATRINYGIRITGERLNLVEKTENFLKNKNIPFSRCRIVGKNRYVLETKQEFLHLLNQNILNEIRQILGSENITVGVYQKGFFDR